MLYILFAIILFVAISLGIGIVISGPVYHGPVSDHFDGRKFHNFGNVRAKGLIDVIRWMATRKRGKWQRDVTNGHMQALPSNVEHDIRVTFINHTTFLIQTAGVNILLDPIYSERASPFSWIGPRRIRTPGIGLQHLPKIDYVILSHNHYDHLDLPTLKILDTKDKPSYVVPLGVDALLKKHDLQNVRELDWWQISSLSEGLSIQSVPAQHFSGRGTLDRDKTLWCGYVIRGPVGSLYFAGDTGYHEELFKIIGVRSGSIDLAIIPIGAFKPEWFMSPIHCTPEQAVQIHLDVNSRQSIASHFGTFPLGDDSQADPLVALDAACKKNNLDTTFIALKEGESFSLKGLEKF
jgi:L-ascorbate metabolism protein UlaG (beta-lactamase superfamily)